MSDPIDETNQVSNENQETEEKPIEKIIIKKASKPRAKPTQKTVKKEKPSIKVKNEIDEVEVIEFIKKN